MPRTLQTYLNGAVIDERKIPTNFSRTVIPVHLTKGYNEIMFYSLDGFQSPRDIKELNSNDVRTFSFAFQNISIEDT
jgi:hypothetical protein